MFYRFMQFIVETQDDSIVEQVLDAVATVINAIADFNFLKNLFD